MFDAAGGDVGDDADDDQRNERHDRDRRVDSGHQHDGDGDDAKPTMTSLIRMTKSGNLPRHL
jgi:hypothetical protein